MSDVFQPLNYTQSFLNPAAASANNLAGVSGFGQQTINDLYRSGGGFGQQTNYYSALGANQLAQVRSSWENPYKYGGVPASLAYEGATYNGPPQTSTFGGAYNGPIATLNNPSWFTSIEGPGWGGGLSSGGLGGFSFPQPQQSGPGIDWGSIGRAAAEFGGGSPGGLSSLGGLGGAPYTPSPGAGALDWTKLGSGLFGGSRASADTTPAPSPRTDPAPGMTMPGGLGSPMSVPQQPQQPQPPSSRSVFETGAPPITGVGGLPLGGGVGGGGLDWGKVMELPYTRAAEPQRGMLGEPVTEPYNPYFGVTSPYNPRSGGEVVGSEAKPEAASTGGALTPGGGLPAADLAEDARARLAKLMGGTGTPTGRTAESAREAGGAVIPPPAEAAAEKVPFPQPRPAAADERVDTGVRGRQNALETLRKELQASDLFMTSGYRDPTNPLSQAFPQSAHAQGRAFDVRARTPEQADTAIGQIRELLNARGLQEGTDYRIIDEVRNPSRHATGPHVHTQFTEQGMQKYQQQVYQDPNPPRPPANIPVPIPQVGPGAALAPEDARATLAAMTAAAAPDEIAGATPLGFGSSRGAGTAAMREAYPDVPAGIFTGNFARPESGDLVGKGFPAGLVQRFEDLPDITPPAPGWGDWFGNIGKQFGNPLVSPAQGGDRTEAVENLKKLGEHFGVNQWSQELDIGYPEQMKSMPENVRLNLLTAAHNTGGSIMRDPGIEDAIKAQRWDVVDSLSRSASALADTGGRGIDIQFGTGNPDFRGYSDEFNKALEQSRQTDPDLGTGPAMQATRAELAQLAGPSMADFQSPANDYSAFQAGWGNPFLRTGGGRPDFNAGGEVNPATGQPGTSFYPGRNAFDLGPNYNYQQQQADLQFQRAPYMQQIENSPALQSRIVATMLSELGTSATDRDYAALVETLFNRAAATGKFDISSPTLLFEGSGGKQYYEGFKDQNAKQRANEAQAWTNAEDPDVQSRLLDIVRQVGLGGSNVADLPTDNASRGVAAIDTRNPAGWGETLNYVTQPFPGGPEFYLRKDDPRPGAVPSGPERGTSTRDYVGGANVDAIRNWYSAATGKPWAPAPSPPWPSR
jgi:hypothetical protein